MSPLSLYVILDLEGTHLLILKIHTSIISEITPNSISLIIPHFLSFVKA